MRKIYKLLISLFAAWTVLAGFSAANAQELIAANPADRGDARASLVNAAVAAYQDRLFTVGTKILFYGVGGNSLDFRHSYFNLTTSNRRVGNLDDVSYGLQGQLLQTPMFNTIAVNALFAKRWQDKFSVGATLGFAHRGFDRSQFLLNENEEDDPLLNGDLSKWIFPDIGLGFTAVPSRFVTVAVSVNHLTQPNVALSDTVMRLPRSLNAGVAVGFGSFRGLLGLAYDNHDVLPMIALESFRERLGFVRAGFGRDAVMFEGAINVMEGIALNVRYSYPLNELSLASSGSPELGLVFNFDKNPSLYAMEWREPEVPRRPAFSLADAFLVESIFDTLQIVEKYITRQVDSTVTADELARLPRQLFFSSDSLEPDQPETIYFSQQLSDNDANLPRMGAGRLLNMIMAEVARGGDDVIPQDSTHLANALKKNHTPDYMATIERIGEQLNDPNFRATVIVPRDRERVELMLRYLSFFGPVTDRITIAVEDTAGAVKTDYLGAHRIPEKVFYRALSAPADTFRFSLNMEETELWGPVDGVFIIEDARGNILLADSSIVSPSSAHNQILHRKIWHWQWDDKSYPLRGNYYYYIKWQSADGSTYRSPKRRLTVEVDKKPITIKISKRRQYEEDAKRETTAKPEVKATIRMN